MSRKSSYRAGGTYDSCAPAVPAPAKAAASKTLSASVSSERVMRKTMAEPHCCLEDTVAWKTKPTMPTTVVPYHPFRQIRGITSFGVSFSYVQASPSAECATANLCRIAHGRRNLVVGFSPTIGMIRG